MTPLAGICSYWCVCVHIDVSSLRGPMPHLAGVSATLNPKPCPPPGLLWPPLPVCVPIGVCECVHIGVPIIGEHTPARGATHWCVWVPSYWCSYSYRCVCMFLFMCPIDVCVYVLIHVSYFCMCVCPYWCVNPLGSWAVMGSYCVLIPCECPPSVCIMNIWYIHTYTQEMSVGLVFHVLVSFAKCWSLLPLYRRRRELAGAL
jgi:hypothetical protein